MNSALIVGQPNVGKTSFVINFAYYLGLDELRLMIRQPAGFVAARTYHLEQAYDKLTSDEPHSTNNIQSIQLSLPIGKQDKKLRLVDSCGLVDQIHPDKKIRKAMAQTLQELLNSEIVLHMIDLTQLDANSNLDVIDQEIYSFFKDKAGYKILANKVDVDIDRDKLMRLKQVVDQRLIIAISALYEEGFAKVKSFLLQNL